MRIQTRTTLAALVVVAAVAGLARPAQALTQEAVDKLVQTIDERQRNTGDFKAVAYLERKERNKNDVISEATIFRRDTTDRFIILFSKPKEEAGKGYLRIDKNLFFYDPTVGKWERRTERERIGGTDSRRNDFDESRLAEEYTARFVGDEKLGKFDVHQLELKVRPKVEVAFPVVKLWVDSATGNILKRQDFALSGKLMRTLYYPRWNKLMSESKGGEVYFPGEIRIYDEIEKGNQTTIVFRSIDLKKLDDSIFTKAWLEARSR